MVSQRFRVGSVLARSMRALFAHPLLFLGTMTVAALPGPILMVAGMFLAATSEFEQVGQVEPVAGLLLYGGMLLNIILQPVGAAWLTYAVFEHLRGERPSFDRAFRRGLKRIVPIVVVAVGLSLATSCAFYACVVPAVFVAAIFYVCPAVAVVEDRPISEIFGRSFDLTRGHRLQIAGLVLLIGVIYALVYIILLLLVAGIGVAAGASEPALFVGYLLTLVATTIVFSTIWAITSAVAYHDLRLEKEGLDADQLARVFA